MLEYDTTILSPVSFWVEVFTSHTLKQNCFHKENLFEKEHIFYQNFQDKTRFWNKLSQQRFRMRFKNFKTCQFSKLKSSKAWKFEGKIFSENQCLRERLLLKMPFLHNFTQREGEVLRFRALLKNMEETEKNLGNKIEWKFQKLVCFPISSLTRAPILKRETENVSVFQPTFYNSSNFENRFLKRVRFWLNFFTTRQFLNRKNFMASKSELKSFFRKTKYAGKPSIKKKFFLSFHTVTTSTLTIFRSLESLDFAEECNGEKKTNYNSKVQETIRFWISFL